MCLCVWSAAKLFESAVKEQPTLAANTELRRVNRWPELPQHTHSNISNYTVTDLHDRNDQLCFNLMKKELNIKLCTMTKGEFASSV